MMSRKFRYSKNNQNQSRNIPNNRRQFNDHSNYSEHDNRFDNKNKNYNSASGGRGRNNRYNNNNRYSNDLRNNIRSNKNQARSEDEFYKIVIPHGNKYEQSYLFDLIRKNLDESITNIIFYNFRKEQNAAVFYVLGSDAADTLKNLSRRISTDSGHPLVINAFRGQIPNTQIDDNFKVILKSAMSRLYDVNTRVMNLSKFSQANEFKVNGIFVPVGKANVLRSIVDIIKENTPEILALNLSDNKINSLDALRSLGEVCLSIKAIDLSQNRIHLPTEVDCISNMDLIELVFEGNPFIETFSSRTSYISSIRKKFKNLLKLDNEDLPNEIGFDLGVSENLPDIKDSYLPLDYKDFIYGFLESFYKIYDSEDRQPLIQAYHNASTFSMSVSRHEKNIGKGNDLLLKESHNLLRLKDESLWVKFVKTTNIDIVSFLCKMPFTKHDPNSFKIDIPIVTQTFMVIVINGLFEETFKNNKPLRSFCRTFFLVPQGTGFVIVNDMLLISNPSVKQLNDQKPTSSKSNEVVDKMMSDIPFTPSHTINLNFGQPITQPTTSTFNQTPSTSLLPTQEEIIVKFMNITQMNRDFSLKCLQENNFNPNVAYEIFKKLQSLNALPPEAFIK